MEKMTVLQVKEMLANITATDDPMLTTLKHDKRKGVQQLLQRWYKNKEKERVLQQRFIEMTRYENDLRAKGYQNIVGIDEVGRGPLAGPVVAAAVMLPAGFYLPGINDSKKLTEEKRENYFRYIQDHALAIGVGTVPAYIIDEINIFEATKKAMLLAVEDLTMTPDYLLVDAMKLSTNIPQQSIVKGDANSVSIAAASIIAKVTRDRYMKQLGEQFPDYHFEKNMGYGTKQHILGIKQKGITPYHRKSFAPIANKNEV